MAGAQYLFEDWVNECMGKIDFKLLLFWITTWVSESSAFANVVAVLVWLYGEASEMIKVRSWRRRFLSGSYPCLLKFCTLDPHFPLPHPRPVEYPGPTCVTLLQLDVGSKNISPKFYFEKIQRYRKVERIVHKAVLMNGQCLVTGLYLPLQT